MAYPQAELVEEPIIAGDEADLLAAITKRSRRDLSVRLSKSEKESLALRIREDFYDSAASNDEFRQNHVEFMSNWRGIPEPADENHPLGEMAANVKVPLTTTYIEQWKARLSKIIIGDGRIAKFYSLIETIDKDHLEKVSKWFNWELLNVVKIEKILNEINHYLLVDGLCLSVPCYKIHTRRVVNFYEYDFDVGSSILVQIQQAIEKCFNNLGLSINDIIQNQTVLGKYQIDLEGVESLADVTVVLDKNVLVLEVEYDETYFDGVEVKVPNIEDVVVMNTDPDPEKIPFVGYRSWLAVGDFLDMYERGEFPEIEKEDLSGIIAFSGPKTPDIIPMDTTIEQDLVEGADSTAQPYALANDHERQWLEIFQWEGWIEYKKQRVGVAVWTLARGSYILKILRLTELNREGKRTCVKHDFIPVPGRFFSMGMSELMRHAQTEIDGVHNFRLDSALVATVPFGFYAPTAGAPATIIGLRPGRLYPIKDPKAIVFPNLNWNPIWGFQEEGLIRKYASELAGIGDLGLGTFTSKRTSASEFVGTAQSIDIRTEHIAKTILRGVEELFYRIFALYQQHAKGKRVFIIAGEDGAEILESVSVDSIQGKLKLQLVGSVKKLQQQIEKEVSMQMLNILLNQFAISLGIVKPDTIYEAIVKVMEASEYKGVPLHKPNMPPDSPPPNEELSMINAGIYPPPHIGENFAEHLQAHMMTLNQENIEKLMSPSAIAMLQRHIQETMQLAQQVQIMQQQQAMQAASLQAQMATMGIRPGQAGATDSSAANPGTGEEGIAANNAPESAT